MVVHFIIARFVEKSGKIAMHAPATIWTAESRFRFGEGDLGRQGGVLMASPGSSTRLNKTVSRNRTPWEGMGHF
jgi:hypothetical protein